MSSFGCWLAFALMATFDCSSHAALWYIIHTPYDKRARELEFLPERIFLAPFVIRWTAFLPSLLHVGWDRPEILFLSEFAILLLMLSLSFLFMYRGASIVPSWSFPSRLTALSIS